MKVSQRIGDRRLLKLARILDRVEPEKFDLGVWASSSSGENNSRACGFAACAVGWATQDRSFRRAGLRLESTESGMWYPHYLPTGEVAFSAVVSFFGLTTYGDSFHLFSHESYSSLGETTAQEVAERIREYVRNRSNQKV